MWGQSMLGVENGVRGRVGLRSARSVLHILRLAVVLLVLAVLPGTRASAHVFQTSEGVLFFAQDGKSFSLQFNLNLEAMLAGVDPTLKDTAESPNAPEYDRLRRLPPEELEKVFDAERAGFESKLKFVVDGQPVQARLIKKLFREVGDLTLARSSSVSYQGDLPPGAKVFSFGWDASLGKLTIRTVGGHTRSMHIEVIEPGAMMTPLTIADVQARTIWDMIFDFIGIGFHHIVPEGLDHILFVVGIFLLSTKLKPILTQVTAFTVAHTVTLGLGTAGVVNLPPSIVEPLIAASIAYVAVENIMRPTLSPWRPAVVFMFGLLHGLGFAGILRDFNLQEGDFLVGLLSFNVGVELGQLTVIATCFLLVGIWFGNKPWYRQRIVIPGSLIIAAVGTFWFFQRVFFA